MKLYWRKGFKELWAKGCYRYSVRRITPTTWYRADSGILYLGAFSSPSAAMKACQEHEDKLDKKKE